MFENLFFKLSPFYILIHQKMFYLLLAGHLNIQIRFIRKRYAVAKATMNAA